MSIEEEIFRKSKVDFDKLKEYGFEKIDNTYQKEILFMDNFKAVIKVSKEGIISGKVFDLELEEEYLTFRIKDFAGSFSNEVKEEYKKLLNDIKKNCFVDNLYISRQANKINYLIKEFYNDNPKFLWDKYPDYAVYKNKSSDKWYAIIMTVDRSKFSDEVGEVEILDIKLDEKKIEKLLKRKGFYKAYHMNKKSWITITLDDTVSDEELIELIDESYRYTVEEKNKNEWIIPANPYYDVITEFNSNDEVLWKQSTKIKIDDIVYMYIGSPYSSIMYKAKVIEIDIPYNYSDKNVKMNKLLKLKVLKRYKEGKYPFSLLKEFKITSVRGPRYMTKELSDYINDML